jgi:inner membrane protein involved in colicin E2 resistance
MLALRRSHVLTVFVISVVASTEFSKVAIRTAIGFIVMGFIGFFVKLIFIPINNIIVGSG